MFAVQINWKWDVYVWILSVITGKKQEEKYLLWQSGLQLGGTKDSGPWEALVFPWFAFELMQSSAFNKIYCFVFLVSMKLPQILCIYLLQIMFIFNMVNAWFFYRLNAILCWCSWIYLLFFNSILIHIQYPISFSWTSYWFSTFYISKWSPKYVQLLPSYKFYNMV